MTQNITPVFSDSHRVIKSVSEEKMKLYGSAHGRELGSRSLSKIGDFTFLNKPLETTSYLNIIA